MCVEYLPDLSESNQLLFWWVLMVLRCRMWNRHRELIGGYIDLKKTEVYVCVVLKLFWFRLSAQTLFIGRLAVSVDEVSREWELMLMLAETSHEERFPVSPLVTYIFFGEQEGTEWRSDVIFKSGLYWFCCLKSNWYLKLTCMSWRLLAVYSRVHVGAPCWSGFIHTRKHRWDLGNCSVLPPAALWIPRQSVWKVNGGIDLRWQEVALKGLCGCCHSGGGGCWHTDYRCLLPSLCVFSPCQLQMFVSCYKPTVDLLSVGLHVQFLRPGPGLMSHQHVCWAELKQNVPPVQT